MQLGELVLVFVPECAPAHVLSVTGRFLRQTLRRIGAAGRCVSETLLSALCLAMVAPGAYLGFLCSRPPQGPGRGHRTRDSALGLHALLLDVTVSFFMP